MIINILSALMFHPCTFFQKQEKGKFIIVLEENN